MKKAIALAALLMLAPAPANAHPDSESWINCHAHWRGNTEAVKYQIGCLAKLVGSPGGASKALAVADCESDFRYWLNDYYLGLFQQHPSYWAGRADTYLNTGKGIVPENPSALNARWNSIVSMKLAKASGTWSGHWPVCGR